MSTITLPALSLANAWLNVSLSSGTDDSRPVLYRTVLVEVFETGVQLVATDSFMLFGSFVPTAHNDLINPPSYDEAPTESFLVIDPDQRMRGLMRHMRKEGTHAAKNNEPCDVTISFRSAETDSVPTLDPSLDRQACIVDADRERLVLPLYEGEFPTWRSLIQADGEAVETVAFSPSLLGRFGKLVGVDAALKFTFNGPLGLCHIDDTAGESYLFGGLMPVRTE